EVIGVLELFSSRAAQPDGEDMELLASTASLIAQFMRRREAEREVRESEARNSAIVNAALDSIIGIDGGGHITEFNPAAEATFGRSREDVLGMPFSDLLLPDALGDRTQNVIDRMLAGREPQPLGRVVEAVGMHASGRQFPAELALAQVDMPGAPAFS